MESGDPEDELTAEAVELCRKLGSNATRVSEIAGGQDKAIHAAIQEGINTVNKGASSNAQRIQKWIILDRDFSLNGGELGKGGGGRGHGGRKRTVVSVKVLNRLCVVQGERK